MTSRDFCYWLQGYLEVRSAGTNDTTPGPIFPQQVECIQKHLALVFEHEIDPSQGTPEHQAELQKIHDKGPGPTEPLAGHPAIHGWQEPPRFRC